LNPIIEPQNFCPPLKQTEIASISKFNKDAMSFSNFGLLPALIQATNSLGYSTPTPVQSAAISPALQGLDILASAQTGSGKTVAFALPMLQHVVSQGDSSAKRPKVLVLVPTRELATQVGNVIRNLALHLLQPIKLSVVFGGVSINPQMMGLRGGTDIVVATPGRLLDLIAHNALVLSHISMLVLDEADRLLDLGFAEELAHILKLLPLKRQNLFFSATFPSAVQLLAQKLLHDPVQVKVVADIPMIEQRAIAVSAPMRTQLLRHLIGLHQWSRILVFVASKYAAEIVADKLRKASISAEPFHGELSQGKRSQVLADFKASRLTVVVATDLAARGLDITQLPVVVNYDLPRSTDDYTHRIGRTGRAGETGLAINFVSATTRHHWHLIEKRQKINLQLEKIAGFETNDTITAPSADPQTPLNGGVKGQRPNKKDKLRALASLAKLDKRAD